MSDYEFDEGLIRKEAPGASSSDELVVVRAIRKAFARADYDKVRESINKVDTQPGAPSRIPFFHYFPGFLQEMLQRGRYQKQVHRTSLLKLRSGDNGSSAFIEWDENITTGTSIYNASFGDGGDPPSFEHYCVYVRDDTIVRTEIATEITSLAQRAQWIDNAFDAPIPKSLAQGIM